MSQYLSGAGKKRTDNQRRHLTSIHTLTNLNVREVKQHFRPFFEEAETPAPPEGQIKSKVTVSPQKAVINNNEATKTKTGSTITFHDFDVDIPSSITFDDVSFEETLPGTLVDLLEGDSGIKTPKPLKYSPRKTFNQLPDLQLDCSFKQPN